MSSSTTVRGWLSPLNIQNWHHPKWSRGKSGDIPPMSMAWSATVPPVVNRCNFPRTATATKSLSSGKRLHMLWKITMFNGKTHYKWTIFNSYVSLPEGIKKDSLQVTRILNSWFAYVYVWRCFQVPVSLNVYAALGPIPASYKWGQELQKIEMAKCCLPIVSLHRCSLSSSHSCHLSLKNDC
jgi:hypothetical protein